VRCRHRLPRLAGLVDPAEMGEADGCTAQMPLKERRCGAGSAVRWRPKFTNAMMAIPWRGCLNRSHEAICAYRPVTCPNAPACAAPPMLAMRLDDHLATCAYFQCPNVKAGYARGA